MPKQNDLPTPVTVNQRFLAKAAGMDVELPTAITMDQMYLQAIANGGSIEKLKDVAIENPESGEVMKYDAEQEKWVNGTVPSGGGTSDYTDLTNKPKINGVTLAGNKSLSEIGAADASETYTDAEIDTFLTQKADVSDVYTKAQTDTLLDRKVDNETGKGLSTNDFTDAYKEAVEGAAPQATTYTKTEVDTALAAKLNTADVDAALSNTSTNPVQNKSIQAPLARLVDAGAKNLLNLNTKFETFTSRGITYSDNGDGTIKLTGTSTEPNSYVNLYDVDTDTVFGIAPGKTFVLCCLSNTTDISLQFIPKLADGTYGETILANVSAPVFVTVPNNIIGFLIRIGVVYTGATVDSDVNGMLCTAEDYAISPEFVPYAPSNLELYEMILALQNA